jgi:hypothetical protein
MTTTPTTRLLLIVVLTASATALPRLTAQHAAVSSDRRADLATASPESVGVSSERLKRLDAALKRLVDEGRLAGLSRNLVYQAIVAE